MRLLLTITMLCSTLLLGQNFHPNNVRKAVYDTILSDIKTINPMYFKKRIVVDATVGKFDDVVMTTFGVKLADPEYKSDLEFCKILPETSCVEKLEIDQFKHEKVLQNHDDNAYDDFYGIYAPIDHWFEVIQHTFEALLMNEKPKKTTVIIPMKNVYLKNGENIETNYFYKITLDNQFKIIQFQRIKF